MQSVKALLHSKKQKLFVESIKKMQNLFISGDWEIGRDIQTVGDYEGELKDGKRHGLGRITYNNGGGIIFGEFKDNDRNGLCI